MIWNVYFGALALITGFFSCHRAGCRQRLWQHLAAQTGGMVHLHLPRLAAVHPVLLCAISCFSASKASIPVFDAFTSAWLGALIVLFLNTAAYSAEIFYGALRSIPKGDIEAADAYGLSGWTRFRRVIWPTMLRLAWPAYTNEAIFLFHATTLVFFSGFPAWQQKGDALYYASYFADKTFNPFVPYPILAGYFILADTLGIITHIRHAAVEQMRALTRASLPTSIGAGANFDIADRPQVIR